MNYHCSDRGTEHCPCHLMESGQCYTCTMISKNICSCEDKAGWQGTCPYMEYLQRGSLIDQEPCDRPAAYPILSKTYFAPDLAVIEAEVPLGLSEQCQQIGIYMMAEVLGWRTPLSVLRSRPGALEFLVKDAGLKTRALLREAENAGVWYMAGPYYNGLPGSSQLKEVPELVIARGVAAAPLIHMLDGAGLRGNCILYLDDEGLTETLLQEYLENVQYQKIRLREESEQLLMHRLIYEKTAAGCPVLLLVSPYYGELLCSGLSELQETLVIRPNPANLCCGMGICGSCSHTDSDGVTVKLCKCGRTVIK